MIFILYTRDGCHLCERLESLVLPLIEESGSTLSPIDIEEDPASYDLYWSRIPVLMHENRVILEGRPSEAEVKNAMLALLR